MRGLHARGEAGRVELLEYLFHDGLEDVLLVPEIFVKGAVANLSKRGDLLHARSLKASAH